MRAGWIEKAADVTSTLESTHSRKIVGVSTVSQPQNRDSRTSRHTHTVVLEYAVSNVAAATGGSAGATNVVPDKSPPPPLGRHPRAKYQLHFGTHADSVRTSKSYPHTALEPSPRVYLRLLGAVARSAAGVQDFKCGCLVRIRGDY